MTEFRIVVYGQDEQVCAASQGMDFATASRAAMLMRCKGYDAAIAVDTRPLTKVAATPGAGFHCHPFAMSPGSCPLHQKAPPAAPTATQPAVPPGTSSPLVKIHVPAALNVWVHAIARVVSQALRVLLPIEAVPPTPRRGPGG